MDRHCPGIQSCYVHRCLISGISVRFFSTSPLASREVNVEAGLKGSFDVQLFSFLISFVFLLVIFCFIFEGCLVDSSRVDLIRTFPATDELDATADFQWLKHWQRMFVPQSAVLHYFKFQMNMCNLTDGVVKGWAHHTQLWGACDNKIWGTIKQNLNEFY